MKFSEIQLHPLLQANIDKIQFVECTSIQEQAIPWIRKAKDVAGLAQTGTGKTGAFLIPLIDRLLKAQQPDPPTAGSETVAFSEWKKKQFVLILEPTRELADQVQSNASKLLENTGLSSVAIFGGTTYDKQVAALKSGVEFVIATPGRLIDLYKEHMADLGLVRAIIFDEADRMFDMGFKDDMKYILKRVPRERQFLVFSATLNFDVLNVAYEFGSDPIEINISRDQPKAENVQDQIIHLGQSDKPAYLLSLLKKKEPRQAIIFSNFKHNVEKITRFLNANGIPAVGISSLMTQAQRNRVMAQFKGENDRNILVATDLAARGLDILGVDLVMNFELPDDAENYVHRIGRTGRAGQTGTALSLVSDRDVDALQRIEDYLKHKVDVLWLDDTDIIREFEAFPRDEERYKKPGHGRSGGRDQGRRDQRGGSGGDRGRGPRRERGGGGPRPAPARAAGEGGGPRPQQVGGGRPSPRPQQGGSRPESHRDRHTGRHRDGAAAAAGNGGGSGGQGSRRSPSGSRSGNGPQPRQGGQGRGRGGSQGRNAGGSRPAPRGGGSRPTPVGQMAAQKGLGSKVSGFFKKLFGG